MTKKTQETSSRITYTPEIGHLICAEISDGKSLRSICKMQGMPDKKTIWRWMQAHPEFKEIYNLAKQERAEGYVEEIIDIADDSSEDFFEDSDGKMRVDKEHINRSRLRVDTRKWIAAKLQPRVYGERVAAELTGANGGPIRTEDVSENEIARRIAFALASGLNRDQAEKTH